MDLGSRHKVDPSFNMSSMTDIVFLLLIFFMLTSNFQKFQQTPNNLPKGGATVVETPKVSVTIMANGDIFVGEDKNAVSMASLNSLLNSKLSSDVEERKKQTVIIFGDVNVNYGTVAEVINIAHQLGTKSSLGMQKN